ncbi:MAG: glycoside hydrolase family 97 protein [Bacteroidales bacterium]|nr:glycoside hydrolase family 97 protein [Bacteroidales bacterium]
MKVYQNREEIRQLAVLSGLAILMFLVGIISAHSHELWSPDRSLCANITSGDSITIALSDASRQQLLSPSTIGLNLSTGPVNWKGAKATRGNHCASIPSPVYRQASVKDCYNSLTLKGKAVSVEFRMYDDGLAYRFVYTGKKPVNVVDEVARYRFDDNPQVWAAYTSRRDKKAPLSIENQLWTDMQSRYEHAPINGLETERLCFTPLLVDRHNGMKLAIAESDIHGYPGMYMTPAWNGFDGYLAPLPKRVEVGGHNDLEHLVKERHDYLASLNGPRSLPWRAFIVSRRDADLLHNDMVYRLASPSHVDDTTWIRPGKVAWEWWCALSLRGVDFVAGVNTPTYKRFIDFAAANGIEYVILDEGWATKGKADLFDVVPEIDLAEIIDYGHQLGVDIILWAGYLAMEKDLERVCQHYADMGVKGFKIDFLDRDDAEMIDFMWRAADACARNHLLVDFHGCSKPWGLQRAYPNVVNYEAVFGLEQMKWTKQEVDMPEYDATLPYIRLLAGPMDYTQGALRNFIKGEYKPNYTHPGAMGTRAHQLAEYVIFDAPLSMLCDSPTDYEQEPITIQAIAKTPTVWDETIGLDGRVGEYVVEARRSGDQWWIGALTNWEPRTLEVTLPEPMRGRQLLIYSDGPNAHRDGRDLRLSRLTIPADGHLTIPLASGGGFFCNR